MYIFHRTSEEKLQIEAPLLVESWNFISTLKSKNKKKKKKKNIRQSGETARHYFLLSVLGNHVCCTSGRRVTQEGQSHKVMASRAATLPTSIQSGTAKLPARPSRAVRNIHAVCVEEGRERNES